MSRQGWRTKARIARTRWLSGLGFAATGCRGVSSCDDSRRSKVPWLAPNPHRSRGGSRQVLVASFPMQVDQILRRRAGARQGVLGRFVTSRPLRDFSRMLARGPAGRCGFALGRTERQLRKPCRSLVRKTRNSEPTECVETAGSVRGAVVHAVCPCSLTVAEVGRRRRFGVSTFGCGWK